jgi:hypothetical protein
VECGYCAGETIFLFQEIMPKIPDKMGEITGMKYGKHNIFLPGYHGDTVVIRWLGNVRGE